MARDPQSRDIGNVTYTVQPFDAVKGSSLLLRLGKIVGPALEAASTVGDGSKVTFGQLIGLAFKNLDENDMKYLCDTCAQMTTFQIGNGQPTMLSKCFGEHFAGEYGSMFEWLKFSLEVNFGDFFTVLRKMLTQAVPALKTTPSS